ncbi:polysaccharide deacetylase family protein [Paludibacteraceae bacterium OttesenSCG-928-F17]|nr:polysaccharide deacetylase family protein [Paludibacteraceae bacterium OttesenSCG-928-F17]
MMDFVQYIIRFLVGEKIDSETLSLIGYTDNPEEFTNYKLVIYPSGFFNNNIYGSEQSLPRMPFSNIENVPILYGRPLIERDKDTYILHADIVASTYFLITRYEEMVRRNVRDIHGRFPGRESLPYRASCINYPIVDKYGSLLRKLLRECGLDIPEPEEKINKIYLTHDVDSLTHYRHLRGFLGSFRNIQKIKASFKSRFGSLANDSYYTFPYLYELNQALCRERSNVETIAFIKAGGKYYKEDKPYQNIQNKDFQEFFKLSEENNVTLGLHASYEAGINPALIQGEKERLEQTVGRTITNNRHHFLDSREPEDMQTLINTGITHDFTMGYADIAGFRLGTSRAVRWINPQTRELTDLTLHPLTAMDATLSNERYMNLSEEEAYTHSVELINETKKYAGDLCLLWHNTSVIENPDLYHRRLYSRIIKYLRDTE